MKQIKLLVVNAVTPSLKCCLCFNILQNEDKIPTNRESVLDCPIKLSKNSKINEGIKSIN